MKNFFLILGIVGLLLCCDDNQDSLNAGGTFTSSTARVIKLDTFQVNLSTFKIDSLNSSDSDRLLIGQYVDPYFGTVKSSTYFELRPSTYYITDEAVLDSVVLILGYDHYFYNDTLQSSTLNVHKLLEKLNPEDDAFYNTTEVEYEPTPLVQYTYSPRPTLKDSLHITLPLDFGISIFNQIRDGNINEYEDLRQVFKGFTIQPGALDNSSVIGFSRASSDTYLRFFYSTSGEVEDDPETYDLIIQNETTTAFNNISSENPGSFLDLLTDQEIDIGSSQTGNKSYAQSGAGYFVKITFPTLRNIYDLPEKGVILDANLSIHPEVGSFNDRLPLRDSLIVATVDHQNSLVGQLSNSIGEIYASLNRESEYNEYTYNIPVEVYVDEKLNEEYITDTGLTIFPLNYNDTVDRLVVSNSENLKAKLTLIYAIYEEDEN